MCAAKDGKLGQEMKVDEGIPKIPKDRPKRILPKQELMNAIFTNDMLVEKILKLAMVSNLGFPENSFNSKVVLSTLDIKNFRLVSHSWNKTITKLLKKSNQPLFHLSLTHDNFSGLLVPANGNCTEVEYKEITLLNIFVEKMRQWDCSDAATIAGEEGSSIIPPIHLFLTPSFFQVANESVYQTLFNFFLEHGSDSITRFTFKVHRNRFDFIPMVFPDFSLQKLTHVKFVIERMAWSFIPLIQKLLESAPNLETLDFTSSSCIVTHSVPHLSDTINSIARSRPYSLTLPANTKSIFLYGTLDSCSCFYRIPVDNLTKLETIALSASSCIIRQIDDIFLHVASRLIRAHFIGFTSCVYLFNRNYQMTFMPMPRLETLTVTMPWEIRSELWFQYSSHLPSLKELTLVHHDNDELFHRFLDPGKLSLTLQRCTIICVRPHAYAENGFRSTSHRLDVTRLPLVQKVKECFPNLTHLGIGVTGDYIETLEFVFNNMTSLKSLAIFVESNVKFKTTVCWDALFTGLSDTACDAMVKNDIPGYWNTICLPDDKFPSIRDLKNLEALYLVETSYPSCRAFAFGENGNGGSSHGSSCDFEVDTLPPKGDHFFSELSFHFSFYKMANLKMMACTKGFMPSEKIQAKWLKGKQTKIKNIRSPKIYHLLTAKFSIFDNFWYNN